MTRFSRPLLVVVCFTLIATLSALSARAGNRPLGQSFSPARIVEALARLNPLRAVPDEILPAPHRLPEKISKSEATNTPRVLLAQGPAPFIVNTTSDHAPDGVCAGPLPTADCTLREAIIAANASPDASTINFNISGAAPFVIQPTSALPAIGNPVLINGYSQNGASANRNATGALTTTLAIVLDGTNARGGVSGLTFNGANNCAIRGLNIRNFTGSGVIISNTSTGNTIAGCFIGTNNAGTAAAPNGGSGVQINSVIGNTIGGTTPGDRNLISGNTGTGILDVGDGTPTATGNTIQGNVIGLNAATTAKIANNIGIQINSRDGTTVGSPATGGIVTGAGNIISGNTNEGLSVLNFIAGTDNISIRGNKIGTNNADATGLGNGTDGIFIGGIGEQVLSNTIIGNGGNGIQLFNASSVIIQQNNIGFATNGNSGSGVFLSNGAKNNVIGGTVAGTFAAAETNGNLISGNLTGVSVDSGADDATGNSIRGNTIELNTNLGINLNGNGVSGDGVTANDFQDPDTGDNNLQNFPVITSVNGNVVTGTLNSTPSTTFVLDFYDNNVPTAADAEGSFGLGSLTVTTDASGNAPFTFTASGVPTIIGFTTAVAIDPAGNTSEFSAAVRAPQNFVVDTTSDVNLTACTAAANDCSLRGAINNANANPGAETISFDILGAGVQTIRPNTPLPTIIDQVTIDGYTQPSATANTLASGNNATLLIELNGAGAGSTANGLTLIGNGSSVRGLVINRFGGSGVALLGASAVNNTVAGCFIGTNAAGTAALSNGASGVLVDLGGDINTIGGATPEDRNVISGNRTSGIILNDAGSTSNVVQGNHIGTNAAGTSAIANGQNGVSIQSDSLANTIGGTAAGAGNIIAFNTGAGVFVSGTGNSIRANSIHDNGGLGIDLSPVGITANDPGDADPGANNLQNFPVITAFAGNNIIGNINSTPNTNFTLEFYSVPVADASGNGEGQTLLTSQPISTDSTGNANFSFNIGAAPTGFITATATNIGTGDTSEFSNAFSTAALPSLSISDVTLTEGDTGTATASFTVTLSAASTQTVTVDFATANGTATQPADYTQRTGTVTFTPGQTTQLITIPVVGDVLDEANETFFVNLTNPTNATVADAQGVGTITDNDPLPTMTVSDVSVTEGNTGTPNAVFTVTLSTVSGRSVTVNYATANGTATAPSDYTTATGTLTIPAGNSSGTITVLVQGDTLFEPNETFFLNLTGATNATITDNQGIGTILNDDGSLIVTTTADSTNAGDGLTSLREAITFANGNASADTISFDIPGAGVQTIRPNTPLPPITEQVTIDGYAQPSATLNTLTTGFDANILIALSGENIVGGASGLIIQANNSLINGLIIHRFQSTGLVFNGNSNRLEGCLIGPDSAGTGNFGNTSNGEGVRVNGTGNVIGGAFASVRNIISGNRLDGIIISGAAGAGNNSVAGNFIGTTKTGLAPLATAATA